MKYRKIAVVLLAAVVLISGVAWQQKADPKTQVLIDTMRKDIRTQKQSLVDQGMGLEAAQKSQFWALYEGYQAELNKIWDQRIANIKKYADTYESMTNEVADQLAMKMMELEGQRTELRKKYYAVYKGKMGAIVAARFVQVETVLGCYMDLQIGAEIPILK